MGKGLNQGHIKYVFMDKSFGVAQKYQLRIFQIKLVKEPRSLKTLPQSATLAQQILR
jgi:hypothetical protein